MLIAGRRWNLPAAPYMWTYQLTSGEACGQTTLAAKLVPLNCQGGRDEMGNRNISAMMH